MAAQAAGAGDVFVVEPSVARASFAVELGARVLRVSIGPHIAKEVCVCIAAVRAGGCVCIPAVHRGSIMVDVRAITAERYL